MDGSRARVHRIGAFADPSNAAKIPMNWTYELDAHGNRFARADRVTRPDGSWREEVHQGNCITVKERSAAGEYRETRQCSPGKPS